MRCCLKAVHAVALHRPGCSPIHIHPGFRLGRDHLRALLQTLQDTGVDHVILNLKYGKRPVAEALEELGMYILPHVRARASRRRGLTRRK